MKSLFLVLSALYAAAAFAQAPSSFDAALGGVRSQILRTQAAQKAAKPKADSLELRQLSSELNRQRWSINRSEFTLRDLQRRAQEIERASRPGEAPTRDAFFESDLRRFGWDLRDLARQSAMTAREVERVERAAEKNPELVQAAETLLSEAAWTRLEAQGLSRSARWAAFDFRRIGFVFESYDIESQSDAIGRSAEDAERAAKSIVEKVR